MKSAATSLCPGNGEDKAERRLQNLPSESGIAPLESTTGDRASVHPMDHFLAGAEYKAYKIAVYALRDEQTALDVVQDAMFKLVSKYHQRPASEWPALFFTILNNRITDIRRWRKLHEVAGKTVSLFRPANEGEEDLIEAGLGADSNPPHEQPERMVLSKQLRNQIDSALGRLSLRQRQVFVLREWQGLSVRETATILGCSEGSVKQHHFRAMNSLRAALSGLWPNG